MRAAWAREDALSSIQRRARTSTGDFKPHGLLRRVFKTPRPSLHRRFKTRGRSCAGNSIRTALFASATQAASPFAHTHPPHTPSR
eukprot:4540147-Prymnesium_polylepis.1